MVNNLKLLELCSLIYTDCGSPKLLKGVKLF